MSRVRVYREVQRQQPRIASAAMFDGSRDSVEAILEIARMKDSDARAAFVADDGFQVLLVKTTNEDGETEWEVVEPGDILAYSRSLDVLYTTDPDAFAKEYEPMNGPQ